MTLILISKFHDVDIEAPQYWNPISKFETSISTFLRYLRFLGNLDIEAGDIEVTVFDIAKTFNIGCGNVPDDFVQCVGRYLNS